MNATLEEKVKKIISDQLGVPVEDIKNDSSFIEDLNADSLDTVELVMALEQAFNVEISDEDAEKIKNVQNVLDYIENLGK